MPQSGRRDLKGYLTQIAKGRVKLIKSIAVCSRMHMLRKECIDDSLLGPLSSVYERSVTELEEGDRDNERDREHDRSRSRELVSSKCNHCNKIHPPPCRLISHLDCNPDASIPFAESDKGRQWLQKGHYAVSNQMTLDGTVWNNPNAKPQGNNGHQGNHYHNRHHNQGNYHNKNHHRGGKR